MTTLDDIAQLDKFFVQQKLTPIANIYRVSTVAENGQVGTPLLHVRQKRLKIREQVDIYADESQKELLLRLRKKNIMEFHGRANIELPDGTVIGQLQKVFGASLLRSTWDLLDPQGNKVAWAQESSQAIALLRRFWGFVPVLGDFPLPIPFHFDINIGDQTVGKHTRLTSLVDRYLLDLTGDTERRIDRRVAVAFAIALDSLQDR